MTTETPETQATPETPTTLPPFSLDVLPEPYRTEPLLKDFKNWEDVFKSHVNAAKMVGVDKNQVFRIPKDGDLSEVYKALGKPDNYEFPADLKLAPRDDYKQAIAAKANELNLTKTQFEELLHFNDGWAQKIQASTAAEAEQAREAAQKALKESLGEAYDQTVNLAKDALETVGKPELWQKLEEKGLTHDGDVLGFLAELGKLTKDEGLVDGDNKRSFAMTPAQAGAELNALMGNAEFQKAWLDKSHPGHKDAVQKMWDLQQKAHPDKR